jgi:C-terminal processing protease CtpA/Prc
VRERRRLAEEWSGGRLGYIHIQRMNIPSFEEFEHMLFAAVRENNGAVPDVLVAQPPSEDLSATEDTQLRRAVEVLLADLEIDP